LVWLTKPIGEFGFVCWASCVSTSLRANQAHQAGQAGQANYVQHLISWDLHFSQYPGCSAITYAYLSPSHLNDAATKNAVDLRQGRQKPQIHQIKQPLHSTIKIKTLQPFMKMA